MKKTKRFRYESKRAAKESLQSIPKGETAPAVRAPKRIRTIAIGAAAAAVSILLVFTFGILDSPEPVQDTADTLNVPVTESAVLNLSDPGMIFNLYAKASDRVSNNTFTRIDVEMREGAQEVYSHIAGDNSTIVVYPSFTRSAYTQGGLAEYYLADCTNCISVKIREEMDGAYNVGQMAYQVLQTIGYDFVTDIEVDKNPKVLSAYDKVILLHNEYATNTIFEAVTSHPNVVYLYPGALSVRVTSDYVSDTLQLAAGYGYPDASYTNGFGWKYDNRNHTSDNECRTWELYPVENGHMLNCYPEGIIHTNPLLLLAIKEAGNDPFWQNPIGNYGTGTIGEAQLKVMLLNTAVTDLVAPQSGSEQNVSLP